jgi:prepilin-type N-terminal cleavage/methylation domain-containing protein
MNQIKSKKGYSLVEVIIALTVIVVVSATALTVILYSISLRHAEINKSQAQNFAENVMECFKAADDTEEFERLVKFSEGVELKPIPEWDAYTYTSIEKNFIVGITVDFELERPEFSIEILDINGTKVMDPIHLHKSGRGSNE